MKHPWANSNGHSAKRSIVWPVTQRWRKLKNEGIMLWLAELIGQPECTLGFSFGKPGAILCPAVKHLYRGTSGRRRTLASYFAYYQESRTHSGLDKQCPIPRQVTSIGRIVEIPQLGGLHHRYARDAA